MSSSRDVAASSLETSLVSADWTILTDSHGNQIGDELEMMRMTYRFIRVVKLCMLFDAIVTGSCLKQGGRRYVDW